MLVALSTSCSPSPPLRSPQLRPNWFWEAVVWRRSIWWHHTATHPVGALSAARPSEELVGEAQRAALHYIQSTIWGKYSPVHRRDDFERIFINFNELRLKGAVKDTWDENLCRTPGLSCRPITFAGIESCPRRELFLFPHKNVASTLHIGRDCACPVS